MANVYSIATPKKSEPSEYMDGRVKHLEEWRRASDDYRSKQLGENAFKNADDLYSMKDSGGAAPSFRPSIRIPMLQRIMLEESNQISELVPQIYVFESGPNASRIKDREKALQAQWAAAKVNQHILMASLTARYCGAGFLIAGLDPNLRNGRGGIWCKSLDPRYVGFDPGTDYTWDPSYVYYGTWMNLDDVRLKWPNTSKNIKPRRGSSPASPFAGDTGYGVQMPQGPMTSIPGMPISAQPKGSPGSTNVLVWHTFCKDYTREIVDDNNKPLEGELIDPEVQLKYPNGRWLVDCEGVILSDGPNPYPRRTDISAPHFPIFPVWALPPLHSAWGVPVTNMTGDMQNLAQRMYTQSFENFIRLNNGVWFIDSNTGIDPEAFGGLPGEVQMKNAGSRTPECVYPNALSAASLAAPEKLLELQNKVLGFGDARQGSPGDGNISTDLFDASVLQSSGLLQLAGRLMAGTVQMLGEFMFYTMGRYMGRQNMPLRGADGFEMAEWQGILKPSDYDVLLDAASIRPLSEAVIRRMTPELMKSGIVNTQRGLSTLGYPDADEIAAEQQTNAQLAALAQVKKGSRG